MPVFGSVFLLFQSLGTGTVSSFASQIPFCKRAFTSRSTCPAERMEQRSVLLHAWLQARQADILVANAILRVPLSPVGGNIFRQLPNLTC